MIADTIETYLNLDKLDSRIQCDETEEKLDLIVCEVQSRHNLLQERFIALKTITETLKDQIQKEKDLWTKELRETVALERKLRERKGYESGDKCAVINEEEYKKKYEVFKEFIFFTNATKNMEKIVRKTNYQQRLFDVESKCNMELLKIQHSMTILKPLKEMASKWNKDKKEEIVTEEKVTKNLENTDPITQSGNAIEEKSVVEVEETDSSEEINTAEIREILHDINEIISSTDEIANENDLSKKSLSVSE